MTEEIQDIFDEIRNIMQPDMDCTARYHALDALLLRALKDRTRHSPVDFTHTAARLHWLCKQTGHPSHPLEVFRARAGRIQKGLFLPDGEDEAYDLKAVCEGLAAFYQTHVPEDVQKRLPRHWRPAPAPAEKVPQAKRIRITVHRWDEHFIYGKDHTHPTEQLLKVEYADETDRTFADLKEQLYEGAQLNLLSVKTIKAEGAYPYVLKPEMLVLDPDFLIDITALCACIKPYGYSAYTHLLNKFAPQARSAAIQLGNAANQFLDDCVNENRDLEREETSENEVFRLGSAGLAQSLPGMSDLSKTQTGRRKRNSTCVPCRIPSGSPLLPGPPCRTSTAISSTAAKCNSTTSGKPYATVSVPQASTSGKRKWNWSRLSFAKPSGCKDVWTCSHGTLTS